MTFAERTVQETREHFAPWLDRYEAIGRAQHRYMYLLALLVTFYLVLAFSPGASPATGDPLEVAIIGLSVPRPLVWALGPPVIAFTLLAFLGTFAAAHVALKGLEGCAPQGLAGDAFDRVPNLIDFAVHTRGGDGRPIRVLAASSYPLFATAVLVCVGYLMVQLSIEPELGRSRWLSVVATGMISVWCIGRLWDLWKRKMKRAWATK